MKQILLGVVALGAGFILAATAEARGPGGPGGRSGGGMSNMSAGVRNFNSGGAASSFKSGGFSSNLSSRAMTQNSGTFQNNITSRINRGPVNSNITNRVNNVGGGIGFNRDAVSNKFVPKNGNTGVFGNATKINDKVLDPRVTTRPSDLLGKRGKLNDKLLDLRVTTRPSDLFGKNGSKLGDVLSKNGKLKDVVTKSGRLNDVLKNGRLNDVVKNSRLSDRLNTKLSDKITSKLGSGFLKHAHNHHHHHHHHNDWWCHKDFWCHNDYWGHAWYFDWCFPWYGPDWCWDYYPEVIIDYYPVYVSQPVVTAVATSVDLEFVSVEILDVGEPAKKLGPRFLVTVRNVGTALVEGGIVRLAAGRELNPAAFEKPVEATAPVAPLVPGQTMAVEIRLPLDAMTMNRTAEGKPAPFEALAAAVEPPQGLTDVKPENNFRLTPRKEITLAGF
jgi:hypothetical protein